MQTLRLSVALPRHQVRDQRGFRRGVELMDDPDADGTGEHGTQAGLNRHHRQHEGKPERIEHGEHEPAAEVIHHHAGR